MNKTEQKRRTWKAKKLYAFQCKKLGVKPAENYLEWGEKRLIDDLQVKYHLASKWRRRRALKALGWDRKRIRDTINRL